MFHIYRVPMRSTHKDKNNNNYNNSQPTLDCLVLCSICSIANFDCSSHAHPINTIPKYSIHVSLMKFLSLVNVRYQSHVLSWFLIDLTHVAWLTSCSCYLFDNFWNKYTYNKCSCRSVKLWHKKSFKASKTYLTNKSINFQTCYNGRVFL